jgi:hypothetical protein
MTHQIKHKRFMRDSRFKQRGKSYSAGSKKMQSISFDDSDIKSIRAAEKKKAMLENKGYNLVKTTQRGLDKWNMVYEEGINKGNRTLYDPDDEVEYSGNAGDYWNMKPDEIFKNENGTNLWLMENGTVVKKTVRKRDLRDAIYESQKGQRSILANRKSVGAGKMFSLSTNIGDDYVIDSKGRMTQRNNYFQAGKKGFSGQWLFDGLINRWGNRVFTWDEVLRNPHIIDKAQKPLYVMDLDNGTNRSWSTPLRSIYEDSSLNKVKQ